MTCSVLVYQSAGSTFTRHFIFCLLLSPAALLRCKLGGARTSLHKHTAPQCMQFCNSFHLTIPHLSSRLDESKLRLPLSLGSDQCI